MKLNDYKLFNKEANKCKQSIYDQVRLKRVIYHDFICIKY
jgi:hypothetical protein